MNKKVDVGVVMGSLSDKEYMEEAVSVLKSFNISYEHRVVSAHRTPQEMLAYGETAEKRGLKVIIAAAGGAAHLPGMLASVSNLPVIGVPIRAQHSMDGWDSVLSILQMPKGVPVATMALNGAANAALFATQILALREETLSKELHQYKKDLQKKVREQNNTLSQTLDTTN